MNQEYDPPYYAVIFTSQRKKPDHGYAETAEKMLTMAAQQQGFLGVESFRNEDGQGVTISYWRTLEAIDNWKKIPEHKAAQQQGKDLWYQQYRVRVCRVEKEYGSD